MQASTAMKLIYVIGSYPILTTTFIDREIEKLRQLGFEIQIVAMRRPVPGTPFSAAQMALQEGVIYLLPPDWLKLLLSHFYFAFRRPGRFLGTFFYLLSRPHAGWKARLKTLLHFGEGVYAAYLVRQRPFREFHAHFVDRAATVALVAGRLLDKPYSLSIHAAADIFVAPVLLPEKVENARHIVTCTLYNKRHVETLVGQDLSNKMTHLNHGLELARYEPAPGETMEPPLILAVGQLVERKGLHELVEACHLLRQRGYNYTCRIVGRGPQHQTLNDQIARLGLDDFVVLTGALSHDEVIAWYRRATCFVLPCIRSKEGNLDGIPNVLAEAMAMGVPVISTAISAIPELVEDGVTGLLVPPEETAALSDAIARVLDDPLLRRELSERARRAVVESFDVDRNVRRMARTLWPEWSQDP